MYVTVCHTVHMTARTYEIYSISTMFVVWARYLVVIPAVSCLKTCRVYQAAGAGIGGL